MSDISAGRAALDVVPSVTQEGEAALLSSLKGPLSSAVGAVGVAGAAMGAAVVAGIGIAGVGLFKLGEQFDDVSDHIAHATGASGDRLDSLNQSVKNIVGTVAGTSISDFGDAIALLGQRSDATGPALEELAKQELRLKQVTGEELPGLITATTRVFGDWQIATQDQAGTLDFLDKVSQKTGIGVTDLSDKLVKFGPSLRELGFSFDESAALLGQFEKEGVNTDQVMGALKLSLAQAAKAGEDPAKAFERVTSQIKNAGSAGAANEAAIKLFGARAGPQLAEAIRSGRLELGGLLDDLKNTPGNLQTAEESARDFPEKIGLLWQKFQLFLEPLGTKVFDFAGQVVDGISHIGDAVGKLISGDLLGGSVDLAKLLGLDPDGPAAKGIFFFSGLLTSFVDDVKNLGLGQALENLGPKISAVWPIIQSGLEDLFGHVVEWLGNEVGPLVSAVQSLAQTVVEWIVPRFGPILQKLGELLGAVGSWILDTGLPFLASHLAEWGLAFLEWILPLDAKILAALVGLVLKLAGWIITEGLPTLKDKLGEWGTAFWAWLQEAWPPFLANLEILLGQFGDWITGTAIPWLEEKAAQFGPALWGWITTSLPMLLAKLGEWELAFGNWILTTAIPWLLEKGLELSIAFVSWVSNATSTLLANLPGWLASFGEWIATTAIPWLLEKGSELAGSFVSWVLGMIPTFLSNLAGWLISFGQWVGGTALPWLLAKGAELAANFTEWLLDAAAQLPGKLLGWLEAFGVWLATTGIPWIEQKGGEILGAFLSWVGNAITQLPGQLEGVAKAIVDFVGGMPQRITDASKGLWNGIANAFVAALNWLIGKWNDFSLQIPEIEILGQKVGGFSLDTPDIPLIPALAAGGRAMRGGLALVGEKGAEIARLRQGDAVFPMSAAAKLNRQSGGFTVGDIILQRPVSPKTALDVRAELQNVAFLGGFGGNGDEEAAG